MYFEHTKRFYMTKRPTYEELEKRIQQLQKAESELRLTEGALKESEQKYRSLVDFSPLPFLITVEETIVFVNPAVLRLFGVKDENEVIGTSPGNWIHPDFIDLARRRRCRVLEKGGIAEPVELTLVGKDGREIIVQVNAVRITHNGFPAILSVFQDITQRKRMEEELVSQATRHRILMEQSRDGIVILDQDGQVFQSNRQFADMLGYPFEAMSRLKVFDWEFLYPPERIIEMINSIDEKGDHFETQHRRRDGSIYDVEISTNAAWFAGQKLIFCVCRDITERKRAEKALEKRLVELTQPLDSPEGIGFEDLFNIAEIQRLQDEFAQAVNVASIITHPDGTPITVPSNFCRLCQDIIRKTEKGLTNCFKSDAALGRQKPSGPTVQPCLSGGLWDAGAAISVGGRHIANWLIGQVRDAEQTEAKMRAYARTIGADEEEVVRAFHEVPAMSRQQFEKIARVLFTLANQLSNVAYQNVQQARFIAEQKRAEAEREKLQALLTQAQKMESVGRLAGGVAHDFNNMLGVILGHTELALEKADENCSLYADLKEIQTAARRSADLTKQLLTFARKQIIEPKQMDLNDTVEGMLNMLRRLIGEDIDLIWTPAAHLWPVKMDPSQIDQILVNLCVNAQDAIAGLGKVTIETGGYSFDQEYCSDHPGFIPGDFVLLAVSDNGCGMNQETLDNLFEPFFTTKDVGKGTGLGLATVYGIVKQNNGFIDVYSEPGRGSIFKIYLPRFVSGDEPAVVIPERKTAPGGDEIILLVEDEPAILRMTRMMLERKGYTVLSAATPAEAGEIAKNNPGPIDLLMTDVVMPGMNGWDLAEKITAFYPGIKLLFMSGYTADVIAHQGVLDEGVAFIQKPFSIVDLAVKLRDVLDRAPGKVQD
jgi:PAS domain S-box-containing protein